MKASSHTHLGQRSNNEDAYLCDTKLGLFAVADGMGGYEGGEVASHLVVTSLRDFMSQSSAFGASESASTQDAARALEMAIRFANREVLSQRQGELAHMGSTVAAMLYVDGMLTIAHVGDSRVYRMRQGALESLTVDHSLYSELKLAAGGEDLPEETYYETGHVLTRAVGVPGLCESELRSERVEAGDLYLICSDGLSDVVPDDVIARVMREGFAADIAQRLIGEALRFGADDNVTAVVVAA